MSSIEPRPAPCTLAWLGIVAISLASWRVGGGPAHRPLLAAALLMTLVKGQLVVDHFMGLRRARPLWRAMMAAWLLAVGALVAAASLLA